MTGEICTQCAGKRRGLGCGQGFLDRTQDRLRGYEPPRGIAFLADDVRDPLRDAMNRLCFEFSFQSVFLAVGHAIPAIGWAAVAESAGLIGHNFMNRRPMKDSLGAGQFIEVLLFHRIVAGWPELQGTDAAEISQNNEIFHDRWLLGRNKLSQLSCRRKV